MNYLCILWLLSRGVKFKTRKIAVGKKKLSALIADGPRKMTVGLMFREKLKPDECMLFDFPNNGYHPIWMRNMRFPIDIIWADENGKIVHIVEKAPPLKGLTFTSYGPEKPSRYVVELNAGFVKKNKIKAGNKIKIKNV